MRIPRAAAAGALVGHESMTTSFCKSCTHSRPNDKRERMDGRGRTAGRPATMRSSVECRSPVPALHLQAVVAAAKVHPDHPLLVLVRRRPFVQAGCPLAAGGRWLMMRQVSLTSTVFSCNKRLGRSLAAGGRQGAGEKGECWGASVRWCLGGAGKGECPLASIWALFYWWSTKVLGAGPTLRPLATPAANCYASKDRSCFRVWSGKEDKKHKIFFHYYYYCSAATATTTATTTPPPPSVSPPWSAVL